VERPEVSDHVVTVGNLTIIQNRREILVNGNAVILKPKEYDLLFFFAENQGRVFTRASLLQKVWGWDFLGESRTVDVHVRWLREKIEVDPSQPVRIITVHGVGYRFEG
jgi:DNA-binding response OmpR family regulator